ncbi:MAG: diguanylate cyclase [Halanaerobium sp.]
MELENQKIIFENLFTNSLEGIVLLDQDLKIIDLNKKFEKIFEISKNDFINKSVFEAVNIFKNHKDIKREMTKILEKEYWEDEVKFEINKMVKYCNLHIFSVNNEEHPKLTYIAVDDITASKKRAEELKEVKERLELAVEGANIGIWDWNLKEKYIHFNKNWAQMLGYQFSDLDHSLNTWLDLVHPDDKAQALKDIREHLNGKTEKYFNEHRLKTQTGSWKWIRDIGKVTARDEKGNVVRMVGVHIDIDEEKRSAKKIEYLSNHDELTGLYNRRYFNEELKKLYGSRKYPISIIVGDLNELKHINDNYGHSMGDKYIRLTAEAIKDSLRAEDIVARVGGDEFAVILPDTDYNTASLVVERILANIEQKNNVLYLPDPLSLALGHETADCSNQNCSSQNILNVYNRADRKMYEQKFANRS